MPPQKGVLGRGSRIEWSGDFAHNENWVKATQLGTEELDGYPPEAGV